MKSIGIEEVQRYETSMLKEIIGILYRYRIVYYMGYGSVLGAVRHKGPIPWDTDMDILIPITEFDRACSILERELPKQFVVDDYTKTERYGRLVPRIGLRGNSSLFVHVDLFPLVGLPSEEKAQYKYHKKSTFLNKVYKYKYHKSTSKYLLKRLMARLANLLLSLIPDKHLIDSFRRHCTKYSYTEAKFVMNPCGHYGMKNVLEKSVFGEPVYLEYDGLSVPVPEKYETYLTHYYGDYMKFPSEKEQKIGLSFTTEIKDDSEV